MLRRRPLATGLVTLYTPSRAGVLLRPAGDRWPDNEAVDRLALSSGLTALAAARLDDDAFPHFRDAVAGLARSVVEAGEAPLPAGLVILDPLGARGALEVVEWDGRGRATVTVEIAQTAGGLVPTLRDPPSSEAAVAICALALALALAVDAGAEDRLALALTLEGVVAWYRASHRLTPPRHALVYALAHARDRLREAGRALPPALRVQE